jgi:hypothetical protein
LDHAGTELSEVVLAFHFAAATMTIVSCEHRQHDASEDNEYEEQHSQVDQSECFRFPLRFGNHGFLLN